jgi:hypothetical protein
MAGRDFAKRRSDIRRSYFSTHSVFTNILVGLPYCAFGQAQAIRIDACEGNAARLISVILLAMI